MGAVSLRLSTSRMEEQINLKWKDFSSNLSQSFKAIKDETELHDVTLVCDDGEVNAHKLVLYCGSFFFKTVLKKSKHPHPLLYMKGVKIINLKLILDFLYNGEVIMAQDELQEFINIAMDLKIKGLEDKEDESLGSMLTIFQNEETTITSLQNFEEKRHNSKNNKEEEQVRKIEVFSNEDIERKALKNMVKNVESDGKVSWSCKVCGRKRNDKTRIRKHIERVHMSSKLAISNMSDNNDILDIRNHVAEEILTSFVANSDVDNRIKDFQKENESSFSQKHRTDDIDNFSDSLNDIEKNISNMIETQEVDGNPTWICKVCNKRSSDMKKVRKHLKSNHSFAQMYDISVADDGLAGYDKLGEGIGEEKALDKDDEPLASFSTILSMMEKVPEADGKHTWSCKECNKNSHDKSRIRKHVEIHMTGISYDCPYCEGKKLSSKNSLDQHLYRAHSKK